jgi:hypothetical protein
MHLGEDFLPGVVKNWLFFGLKGGVLGASEVDPGISFQLGFLCTLD